MCSNFLILVSMVYLDESSSLEEQCNKDNESEVHLTVMSIEMDVAEIGLIEKRAFY
jgi:hypothetical protein